MPPLPQELAAVLAKGTPVQIVHDRCPNESDTPDADSRYFEVRTQIVEIVGRQPTTAEASNPLFTGAPEVVELVDFRFGVRADNLTAAMRPLADGLGQKWLQAEEHAGIADPAPRGAAS